jgi:uncharacterized protein (UPF0335 family)
MTADKQLKSYIDRVLRLKEEQDALGDDIRDVYAEAKAEGYDKTVMGKLVAHLRKVLKQGDSAVAEAESIFDTYLQAYHRASGTPVASHTHEEDFDHETGEILEANSRLIKQVVDGMQSEAGRAALMTVVDILIEQEEAEEETHQRPSTNDEPSPEVGPQAEASPAGTGSGTLADREGRHEGEAAMVDLPTNSKTDAAISRPDATPHRPETENRSDEEPCQARGSGEMQDECTIHLPANSEIDPSEDREEGQSPDDGLSVVGANTGGDHVNAHPSTAATAGAPASQAPAISKYRPHCQRPDRCGSGTRDHCWTCRKAMQESAA